MIAINHNPIKVEDDVVIHPFWLAYLSNVVMYLDNATMLTGSRLQTICTSSAAAELPTKAATSDGRPPPKQMPASDRNASPAPIRSTTLVDNAGTVCTMPLSRSSMMTPLVPRVTAKFLALTLSPTSRATDSRSE